MTATSPWRFWRGRAVCGRACVCVASLVRARAQLAEQRLANVLLGQENSALREHDAALAAKLVALVDRVAELERQAGQSPRNSHKPPSSEGYEKPAPRSRRERTNRRPGGQPGHEGTALPQVEVPDEVVAHQLEHRRCACGQVTMAGAADGVPAGWGHRPRSCAPPATCGCPFPTTDLKLTSDPSRSG